MPAAFNSTYWKRVRSQSHWTAQAWIALNRSRGSLEAAISSFPPAHCKSALMLSAEKEQHAKFCGHRVIATAAAGRVCAIIREAGHGRRVRERDRRVRAWLVIQVPRPCRRSIACGPCRAWHSLGRRHNSGAGRTAVPLPPRDCHGQTTPWPATCSRLLRCLVPPPHAPSPERVPRLTGHRPTPARQSRLARAGLPFGFANITGFRVCAAA